MVSIEAELQVGTGFCISGAGLKLTELIPYTLRIEDNVPRQGCTIWVTDGFGDLESDHAEMSCSGFYGHSARL